MKKKIIASTSAIVLSLGLSLTAMAQANTPTMMAARGPAMMAEVMQSVRSMRENRSAITTTFVNSRYGHYSDHTPGSGHGNGSRPNNNSDNESRPNNAPGCNRGRRNW